MKLCSIDWCEEPSRSRGWCQMHYIRWYRGGDMEATPQYRGDGTCIIADCDKEATGRYCSMHRARLKRNGDPMVLKGPHVLVGPDHPQWKGDDIGYGRMHERLRNKLGKASRCDRCDSDGPYQWALNWAIASVREDKATGLPYSTNMDDYLPLSVPCHKTMDLNRGRAMATA